MRRLKIKRHYGEKNKARVKETYRYTTGKVTIEDIEVEQINIIKTRNRRGLLIIVSATIAVLLIIISGRY